MHVDSPGCTVTHMQLQLTGVMDMHEPQCIAMLAVKDICSNPDSSMRPQATDQLQCQRHWSCESHEISGPLNFLQVLQLRLEIMSKHHEHGPAAIRKACQGLLYMLEEHGTLAISKAEGDGGIQGID